MAALSLACLSECPFLIFKVQADFVWVFSDGSLEDLGDCEVLLLIEVDQHQELQVPPGPPGVPARGVVEQVERVVATGEEVGEDEEAEEHVVGEEVRGPAQGGEQVEGDPGVHDCLLCYNMNTELRVVVQRAD